MNKPEEVNHNAGNGPFTGIEIVNITDLSSYSVRVEVLSGSVRVVVAGERVLTVVLTPSDVVVELLLLKDSLELRLELLLVL
jgi:hypothetical protein